MAVNLQLEHISDSQLARFGDVIYATAGIKISPQKKMMLSNRLRRRLKATGLESFDAYLDLLKSLPADDAEWEAFLQEVSTHETFLFRDESHWTWFQADFLPAIVAQARGGGRGKQLRIWSAACSTGDEAYTIATCIAACIPDHSQWKIDIVGTDIGIGAVRQAEQAVFNERSMKLVPESLRSKLFEAVPGTTSWKAKPNLTRWTSFRQHNLLDPLKERPFDLIFVKNVLIYFDAASKKRALANIVPLLAPGGALVTAAAEGVSGLIDELTKEKPWLYRRPSAKAKS